MMEVCTLRFEATGLSKTQTSSSFLFFYPKTHEEHYFLSDYGESSGISFMSRTGKREKVKVYKGHISLHQETGRLL